MLNGGGDSVISLRDTITDNHLNNFYRLQSSSAKSFLHDLNMAILGKGADVRACAICIIWQEGGTINYSSLIEVNSRCFGEQSFRIQKFFKKMFSLKKIIISSYQWALSIPKGGSVTDLVFVILLSSTRSRCYIGRPCLLPVLFWNRKF